MLPEDDTCIDFWVNPYFSIPNMTGTNQLFPYMFLVQLKSTEDFSRDAENRVRLQIDKEHLIKWKSFQNDVMIAYYSKSEDVFYYIWIKDIDIKKDQQSQYIYPNIILNENNKESEKRHILLTIGRNNNYDQLKCPMCGSLDYDLIPLENKNEEKKNSEKDLRCKTCNHSWKPSMHWLNKEFITFLKFQGKIHKKMSSEKVSHINTTMKSINLKLTSSGKIKDNDMDSAFTLLFKTQEEIIKLLRYIIFDDLSENLNIEKLAYLPNIGNNPMDSPDKENDRFLNIDISGNTAITNQLTKEQIREYDSGGKIQSSDQFERIILHNYKMNNSEKLRNLFKDNLDYFGSVTLNSEYLLTYLISTRHNSGLCGTEDNNYILTIKLKTLEDFIMGMKKMKPICDLIKDRNFDMARVELNELNDLIPNNPLYYYNGACIDSLMHKKEECLKNLKTALLLNGNLIDELKVDGDFDFLYDDVDFKKLLHDYDKK